MTNGGHRALLIYDRAGAVKAVVLVDERDYAWASRHRWNLVGADRPGGRMVARKLHKGGRTVFLHREILGLTFGDGLIGDHINGVHLDNRRENLRVATPGQSVQNTPSRRGSSSRYRGVSWVPRLSKWRVCVRIAGRDHYLGVFADERIAARAAEDFRIEHMPFAVRGR